MVERISELINASAVPMGLGQSIDLRQTDASTEGRSATCRRNRFVTYALDAETRFVGTRTTITTGISVLLWLLLVLTISKRALELRLIAE